MPNKDEIKNRVVTDRMAQGVFNELRKLESNRARMLVRWIWELLQNARDTSASTDAGLIASIELGNEELVFQHNGPKFTMEEMAYLIFSGSTKAEEEETIGQYGTGFLTTHLLSPEIDISGQLDGGQSFEFRLKREVSSHEALGESMNRAWDEFNYSIETATVKMPGNFTTRFRYPIGDDTAEVVQKGISSLKLCAPLVVVFNRQFHRIDISSSTKNVSFEVTESIPLHPNGLQKITIEESEDGIRRNRIYILAKGKTSSVAVPLELIGQDRESLSYSATSKLFLGFPLIGTERFSFPSVVNSFKFTATDQRTVCIWHRPRTRRIAITKLLSKKPTSCVLN